MKKLSLSKISKYIFSLAIILSVLGITNNCVFGQGKTTQSNLETPNKGEIFIKEGGWAIPNLSSAKIDTKFNRKIKIKGKGKLTLNVIDYKPTADIITEEPFASIDQDLGTIRYRTIREYKLKNKIFCYKIQVQNVLLDENTKAVTSSDSVLFFFAYYDEDGDGKFESLVLDEIGERGYSLFSETPHIPQWLLK